MIGRPRIKRGRKLKPVTFNEAVEILNKQKLPVLLIHEDGSIEQQEHWTDDLYAGLEASVVEVIRCVDGKFEYFDGPDWKEVQSKTVSKNWMNEVGSCYDTSYYETASLSDDRTAAIDNQHKDV